MRQDLLNLQAQFLQHRPDGTADRLIEKAVIQGHVRIHESADRTFIYHIGAKSLFEAMGEEDNRNRRWRRPYSVKVKLMGLDFVLAHPEHRYLATETEKLEFFVGTLGLKREWLPLRIYRSRDGRTQTTRYFVDKFPLFLSGASSAPAPVVTFCYVDGNLGKPAGFDTHLLEYISLFGRLESVQVVYVSTDQRTFAKAERIFRRLCETLAAKSARVPSDPDLGRLLGHFRARVLLERRETACFDKQQLDRLRDELREFRGPEHEELYKIWREHGDGPCFVECKV